MSIWYDTWHTSGKHLVCHNLRWVKLTSKYFRRSSRITWLKTGQAHYIFLNKTSSIIYFYHDFVHLWYNCLFWQDINIMWLRFFQCDESHYMMVFHKNVKNLFIYFRLILGIMNDKKSDSWTFSQLLCDLKFFRCEEPGYIIFSNKLGKTMVTLNNILVTTQRRVKFAP